MKLVWLTDIHLNFLPPGGAATFGKQMREDHPDAGAFVVTGDIGEFQNFANLINEFALEAGTTYFVLGNHDAYGGSIDGMRKQAAQMKGKAKWLVSEGPLEIAPRVFLVGHDGWYDARNGDARRSNVVMNDFIYIKELLEARGSSNDPDAGMINLVNELGHKFAEEARILLKKALGADCKQIVFATHVPPFAQAAWHLGKVSDANWLPWMSSRAMGTMLREVAKAHPSVDFTVLCGHTHSPGKFQAESNLIVLTGKARYGHPQACGVFQL